MTILKWGKKVGLAVLVLLLLSWLLPTPRFNAPYSWLLTSDNGTLLAARIAEDGQWRFPGAIQTSEKFQQCLLTFEDQYFYKHPGVNPVSLISAIRYNLSSSKKRRGGSTITMQVARMTGHGRKRTYLNKVWEILLAFHLEVNLSKDEILKLYVDHAPFGGNVVGLEAAAWRYYGRSIQELSWAENALLAVLPNAPSLLYPGKGQKILEQKRNRLLDKLLSKGLITKETCRLSKLETVPAKPLPLPQNSQHALNYASGKHGVKRVESTLKLNLQNRAQAIVNRYASELKANRVNNAAAMIMEVKTGNVLAYIGNVNTSSKHGNKVDVVNASRSTGSTLKPFLYASVLDEGTLLPKMMIDDIPSYYAGYSPKNYYLAFDGVVKANEALFRSLNVPFVRLLQVYKVNRFYEKLQALKMNSLNHPSNHYGLSLILGGAEVSLLELCGMYSGMARVVNNFSQGMKYSNDDYFKPMLLAAEKARKETSNPILTAGAIHHTFEALTKLKRPESQSGWKSFSSTRKIAWKTGTSFGNKDAWAIGVTPEYVVGVWAGNADGEGRTGLTGVGSAAPIMFSLFECLPATNWFDPPYDELKEVVICRASGYLAGEYCEQLDSNWVLKANNETLLCPYHELIHVTQDEKFQIKQECSRKEEIKHVPWFVLPPVQEWYYKQKSPLYMSLPGLHSSCGESVTQVMSFAYPKDGNKLYIPKELDGKKGKVVFELVHRNSSLKVFWHLDSQYIGTTEGEHKMALDCNKGKHKMVVVDENGVELQKFFTVVE